MRVGDLVVLTNRWSPRKEGFRKLIGIVTSVESSSAVDPREQGDIASVLWENGKITVAWDYEIEIVKESK
tara:strand:- start:566 stop:775 length:210 start_codon:yes stop_codon:yes gene_type:complete